MSIEGLECSTEMITALKKHADDMTDMFRQLNLHTQAKTDDEATYSPLFQKASEMSAWYVKRKKVANSMKAAATSQQK